MSFPATKPSTVNLSAVNKALLLSALCLLITACERYTWTVNEQPVYNPPSLFKNQRISDSALADCVDQVIIDQHITKASQLTLLNCSYAGIASVDGLTIFSGLKHLDLSGNTLNEIKPLLYLPYLDTVNLEENPALSCTDAALLSKQLTGSLQIPQHCR